MAPCSRSAVLRAARQRLTAAGKLVLLLALGSGCDAAGGQDPEAVIERFIAAANTGQRQEVYRMLGPQSRNRLLELRQSAKRVSGRLALQPEDFLAVGRAAPAWEVAGVRLLRQDDDRAVVQVHSAAGDRHDVTLVKQGRSWRVELPGS